MDLDAKPLQYFIAVARDNSFSRAAARLNVSQPSLSAQIRELERRLGFPLFDRSSRRVALSREGTLFLPQAHQMVAEAARTNRVAREIRENAIHIAAAIYTILIPERVALLDSFSEEHPDISMKVSNLDQVFGLAGLRRGEIDLAFALGLADGFDFHGVSPSGTPAENVLPPDLERLTLLRKQVALLVPAEHPIAGYEKIPLSALDGIVIASLGEHHGAPFIDAVSRPLIAAGATLVVPPEANAIAVERFGQRTRCPAVSIDWLRYADQPSPSDMVRREVEGLDVELELAILRARKASHRPASEIFWHWSARFEHSAEDGSIYRKN